jgi:hypothetical protein
MPNISEKYEEKEFCVECEKKLEYDQSRYCSRECVNQNRREQVVLICANCGEEFEVCPSIADERKHCSQECMGDTYSEKYIGENNPFYGENHSEEIKNKLSRDNIGKEPWNKGKDFMAGKDNPNWQGGKEKIICEYCDDEYKRRPSIAKNSRFCSNECHSNWKREHYTKGGLSHVWKGGISKEPYPFGFNEKLKKRVRKKFGKACVLCGLSQKEQIEEYNRKLSIHHIDYNKKNISKENLVSLCTRCHCKTNYNRSFWEFYFMILLRSHSITGSVKPLDLTCDEHRCERIVRIY